MNRAELIDEISQTTGAYKYEVEKIVKAYEDTIISTLQTGEKIHLHGFMDFSVKITAEKDFKNPRTGEVKILPASRKVKVSMSDRINKLI